jgi:hypothetical protein
MGYSKIGPFTNNAQPPVNKAFLDPLENFLASFFVSGQISRISHFTGTGTGAAQTVSHGMGATPDIVLLSYAGNFGGPPTHPAYWFNATSTQVTIVADNGFFWHALAIAL